MIKYKLIPNKEGNLSVPDYVSDGGYFSSNGNNDEYLVGMSNDKVLADDAKELPKNVSFMSEEELKTYVEGLDRSKIDMTSESKEVVVMTTEEKTLEADDWLIEKKVKVR
ncbi:MAG: hypothetical protein WC307_04935 [Candidatus Nanoarchaeia archaeon]